MSGVRGGADGRVSCPGRWKSSRQTGQDSEGYCWLLSAAACSRRSLSISDWHLLLLLSADLFRLHAYIGSLGRMTWDCQSASKLGRQCLYSNATCKQVLLTSFFHKPTPATMCIVAMSDGSIIALKPHLMDAVVAMMADTKASHGLCQDLRRLSVQP